MKFASLILLTLFFTSCNNQRLSKALKKEKVLNSETINLVMVSAKGCGYCKLAKAELIKYSACNQFRLIIAEKDDSTSISYALEGYKFFPQFILYKGGKKIGTYRGWDKSIKQDIESHIPCEKST